MAHHQEDIEINIDPSISGITYVVRITLWTRHGYYIKFSNSISYLVIRASMAEGELASKSSSLSLIWRTSLKKKFKVITAIAVSTHELDLSIFKPDSFGLRTHSDLWKISNV